MNKTLIRLSWNDVDAVAEIDLDRAGSRVAETVLARLEVRVSLPGRYCVKRVHGTIRILVIGVRPLLVARPAQPIVDLALTDGVAPGRCASGSVDLRR